MYRSEQYIAEFYERIRRAAEQITESFEIILVDDGSPDNSLQVAMSLYENDPRVKVIELARNFSHHKAMMTGLDAAKGDLVFQIDCDLEEEPELLARFHEKMTQTRADVVYGVQDRRKGEFWERFSGWLFYKTFNLLSDYPIPENVITARLMDKTYVRNLVRHRDKELFMGGLWTITGFKQVPLVVAKGHKGSSTYTFAHKMALLVNSITSFSNKPLIFIFYLGALIVAISGIAGLKMIIRQLFFDEYLLGWPSLMVSIWFLGGLSLFCIGVIGIYLAKVFMETKDRPYTVIRRIYNHEKGFEDER